jgi:hypothetical protein
LQQLEVLNLFRPTWRGHQLPFLFNLSLHICNELFAAWCWNNCD